MTEPIPRRGRERTRTQIPSVRALERGLSVLEVLGSRGEMSLSDVARATTLTASTTFRLLETLCQRGFAMQDQVSGRYRLGAGALRVGAAYSSSTLLVDVADGIMKKLVRLTSETSNLAVLDGQDAVYIHQVESPLSIRMFTQLGTRAPLYCTGVGKILLAWLGPEELGRLLGDISFRKYTPNTIMSIRAFQSELELVRGRGYAIDDEEREAGVRCAAAPVRDSRGRIVAALSASGPSSRMTKKLLIQIASEVVSAADVVSARLGFVTE